MTSPISPRISSFELHRWTQSLPYGRITSIEVVEEEQLPAVQRVLQVWRDTYSFFPRAFGEGDVICNRSLTSLFDGRVMVAKDERGVVQAFARVMWYSTGHMIEELIVAPWNNSRCMKFVNGSKNWTMGDSGLSELARPYEGKMEDLTTYTPGMGTLMMYTLCRFVKDVGGEAIALTSSEPAFDFYMGLGMDQDTCLGERPSSRKFSFDLSQGIPPRLVGRVQRYFRGEF